MVYTLRALNLKITNSLRLYILRLIVKMAIWPFQSNGSIGKICCEIKANNPDEDLGQFHHTYLLSDDIRQLCKFPDHYALQA